MNALSPITAKRPTTDLLADQKPDANARLKAFEDTVQAAFAKLNDDPAYAGSDMALDDLFKSFEAMKDELVAQCGEYLKGKVKPCMPRSEWTGERDFRRAL